MNELPEDPIGGAWLARFYNVGVMGDLPVISRVGGRRATQLSEGLRLETYLESMRPVADAAAHLQFHLRHEIPHLEFLARLFAQSGPEFIQQWVLTEPTGQYARRAAFLYEWLTAEQLQVPVRAGDAAVHRGEAGDGLR